MVRTAQSYTEVAVQGRHDAEEHARIASSRYVNELGLYSDTLRATTAVVEAEQREVSAKKNLDVAQRALGMLLGLEQSVIAATEDGLDLPVADLAHYSDAARQRSDLLAMQLRQANASQNVKLAKAGYLPNIGVGATYQFNDHDQPFGGEGESWQVGAFLKWQLFNGMGREHERSKALFQEAAADEYMQAMEKGVSFKVYEAYRGVEEASKNAELAQAAMKTAEEGARLVMVRYENGLSPMVDLLDAQLSLDHARAMTVASKNAYRIAVLTLYYESGTIFQDLGINESSLEEKE
jgi:outer membrane protein TolC